jgi:hypothetical protein
MLVDIISQTNIARNRFFTRREVERKVLEVLRQIFGTLLSESTPGLQVGTFFFLPSVLVRNMISNKVKPA